MLFNKILIARHSPQNGCYVDDGVTLTILPKRPLPVGRLKRSFVSHHFVSSRDLKTKSRYGWVQEVEPFSLEAFVTTCVSTSGVSDVDLAHIETLLSAVARVPVGKPVAACYVERGVERKYVELSIYRVLFYDPEQKTRVGDSPE